MPVSSVNRPEPAPRIPDAPPGRIHALLTDHRGVTARGVIEEMSPCDLRLFLEKPFKIGSLVNIRLTPEGWNCHFDAAGVVHRAELLGGGSDIGIFLSESLAEEIVAACWLEMRRELRYPVIWSLWARSDANKKIIAATVLNYSYSGLQLRMPHAAKAGEKIELLTDEHITTATVRWTAPFNGTEFVCGCQFDRGAGLKLALRVQLRSAKQQ
jgi:hypothetical protein